MSNNIVLEMYEWRGYSAYQVAVLNGFKGTEEEWLASLHGRDGGVATVNGVAHDENGRVVINGTQIKVSASDTRTLKAVTDDVDTLTGAIKVSSDAIDVGGKYIDNARFR